MDMKIFGALLVSLSISSVAFAAYDEALAFALAHLSGASYCTPESLDQKNCGFQCDYLNENGWNHLFSRVYPAALGTSVSFSVFSNDANRTIVVAFRGTSIKTQLIFEALGDGGALYDLETEKPSQQALVQKYFYSHYKDQMRNDMIAQIKSAQSKFKDYGMIFTGHSMGGAFTTLAVTDAVLSGLLNSSNVKVYTFGSPRVGNKAFGDMHKEAVEESYRIVHYKDLVTHVPPCIPNPITMTCIQSGFRTLWVPNHVNHEIFYDNRGMQLGSYKVCVNDDLTCSRKYGLTETDFDDHLHYFGFHVDCIPSLNITY